MEFSQEIINILNYLGNKFGIAIDWSSENVMPYLKDLCERYVQFEVQTSIALISLFVVIMILAGLIWAISGIVHVKCSHNDIAEGICCMAMLAFWASLAIGIIVSMVQAYDIIACYTIPEKVILEYLKTLMGIVNR